MQLIKYDQNIKTFIFSRAKADLETTGTQERTYRIAQRYIGNENAEYYKAIMNENLNCLGEQSK